MNALDKKLQLFTDLKNEFQRKGINAYLGGSISLLLQGYPIQRVMKNTQNSDLDIIVDKYFDTKFLDYLKQTFDSGPQRYREIPSNKSDVLYSFIVDGTKVDIILDDKVSKYGLSKTSLFYPSPYILAAKKRYASHHNTPSGLKHFMDLIELQKKGLHKFTLLNAHLIKV